MLLTSQLEQFFPLNPQVLCTWRDVNSTTRPLECNNKNKRFYIEVDFGLFKKDRVSSFSSNRNPWDYG